MVVVMQENATEAQIEQVVARLVDMGMDVHRSTGVSRTVLGAVGQGRPDAVARLFERIIDEARRLERRVVHCETDETGQVPPAHKE